MNTEYFAFQVNKFWYRLYWNFMLAFSLLLVLIYVVSRLSPSLNHYAGTFGLGGEATLVLLVINLVYLLGAYWFLDKRNPSFAALAGSLLFALLLLNGLTRTDPHPSTYLYVFGWLGATLFNGLYGLPMLLGGALLTMQYILLQSHFELEHVSQVSLNLLGAVVLCSVASFFFWRSRFQSTHDQRESQLSGMLRSSQQQTEILTSSIADGIVVTNTEGKITFINPSAAEMTGWSVSDATGVDAPLVVKLAKEDGQPLEPEKDPFNYKIAGDKPRKGLLALTSRGGQKIVVSLVVSPVMLPDKPEPVGYVSVIRDVSEEREAEKQRADFISTASHEMRTPVAAIEGYLSLALNDKVSTIDQRARTYLDKAHSSTQHLGKLFQDLLTSSKAEDGRLSNHPMVIETGAYMQQIAEDLKFAAEKKGLTAEFVVGTPTQTIDATTKDVAAQHMVKPLYYVYADPDRIREVITNLFDNACKYTEQGKISLGVTGNNDVVQLYVRDTGAGIPPEDVPHLFQKFYRVDNSATRTIGGTGLGLFICRKIVELYHGRIWVESEVGQGSTFYINLPRLSNQRATELQAADASKSPPVLPSVSDSIAS